MALSNWDTLAFGPDGKPCEGDFKHPESKASIEIYKSQIHIKHPDMWTEGGGYMEPVIAVMHEGDVRLAGFDILATRYEPQYGVFVVAACLVGKGKDSGYQYFAGIGASGYKDTTAIYVEKMGLDPEGDWTGGSDIDNGVKTEIVTRFHEGKLEEHAVPEEFIVKDEDLWEGVREDTYLKFIEWLGSDECEELNCIPAFNEWVEKVAASTPQRFNQGDAYLAGRVGEKAETSEPGKAEKPILLKVVSGNAKG